MIMLNLATLTACSCFKILPPSSSLLLQLAQQSHHATELRFVCPRWSFSFNIPFLSNHVYLQILAANGSSCIGEATAATGQAGFTLLLLSARVALPLPLLRICAGSNHRHQCLGTPRAVETSRQTLKDWR